MKKTILISVLAILLLPIYSYALEFTGDLTWNLMTGTEHYKVSYKDTYSSGKRTGALIRMDQIDDKGKVILIDIINTRRNLIWKLLPKEKMGTRMDFAGEPVFVMPKGWEKGSEVKFLKEEYCEDVPCKHYLWTSKDSKFFKINFNYWLSEDNIVIKQGEIRLGKTFKVLSNLKTYPDKTLKEDLFSIPDEYEIQKVQ
jgi:hypothetical protein